MHIRTFRAASLQDALEDIRRQMGDGASVLHTRQVREGWLGWLGKTSVEVTAGLRDDHDTAKQRPAAPPVEHRSGHRGYPLELQDLRALLIDAGVEESTADRWSELTYDAATSSLGGVAPGHWLDHLKCTVAQGLRINGPIQAPRGRRRIVALVGPTGVGKTTTIAKLAAGFRIEARRNVAMITIDTFRIAAVQQLQAYADIMDLPMEVVQTPEEMPQALERLGDAELVLIDTAGRSPLSDTRIDQLRSILRAARPDETHLVLSATGSRESIRNVIDGFAAAGPTAAILTKLDETSQLAGVLAALDGCELPISYMTNGQQVPDDIETADAEALVQGLLETAAVGSPQTAAPVRRAA